MTTEDSPARRSRLSLTGRRTPWPTMATDEELLALFRVMRGEAARTVQHDQFVLAEVAGLRAVAAAAWDECVAVFGEKFFGGPTKDMVLSWLDNPYRKPGANALVTDERTEK